MDPQALLEKISYLTPAEREQIKAAYELASRAHAGQKRLSGEPFITHPLAVAGLLAALNLDAATITAGLLHDAVEDSSLSPEEIVAQFGPEVARLVDGVTKIGKIHIQTDRQADAVNVRKLLVAMANDVRVVLIKLADRLHNMRTIAAHQEANRLRISRETREIYAPLAARLGIWEFKSELEDLAFAQLEPEQYRHLAGQIKRKQKQRGHLIEGVITTLQQSLQAANIPCEISGRYKHLYSIQKKMDRQSKTLDQIYDQVAVRVVVETVPDCYAVLGLAHTLFVPVESRFKDFIAMPKENGYQSLHTTVETPSSPLEIQIRTREMNARAGYGIAAHWQYKEGGSNSKDRLVWLQLLLAWQKDLLDAEAFVKVVKSELFQEEVYVFTPRGEIRALKKGSTPLDFAYRIHSDVGHHCVGAKVNGKMVPLSYVLQNGETVEVLTNKATGPSRDWLNSVATSSAREKIRLWFKNERREENIATGQEELRQEIKKSRLVGVTESLIAEVAADFHYKSVDDFLAAIGYGEVSTKATLMRLAAKLSPDEPVRPVALPKLVAPRGSVAGEVLVSGMQGVLTTLATCCQPVSGEDVVGYITRGKGVTIHRRGCKNITSPQDLARLCEISWEASISQKLPVRIVIQARPRPQLLRDLLAVASEAKIPFQEPRETYRDPEFTTFHTQVEIESLAILADFIQKLGAVKDVHSVARAS